MQWNDAVLLSKGHAWETAISRSSWILTSLPCPQEAQAACGEAHVERTEAPALHPAEPRKWPECEWTISGSGFLSPQLTLHEAKQPSPSGHVQIVDPGAKRTTAVTLSHYL